VGSSPIVSTPHLHSDVEDHNAALVSEFVIRSGNPCWHGCALRRLGKSSTNVAKNEEAFQ
jgi:hypothetical protein